MYKTLLVITGSILLPLMVFNAVPAAALSCAASYPTIGVVQSITQQGSSEWSSVNLGQVGVFDASSFSGGIVNIDTYNTLAKKFIENGYQVPPGFQRTLSEWETQANVLDSSKSVTITTSGIGALVYSVGDVVIVGPPGGALCRQYGFIGFFGSDGVIKSAFAHDSEFLDYSYGSETLVVNPGADYECVSNGYGSTSCKREVQYSLGGSAFSLRAPESRNLSGNLFSGVTVVRSDTTFGTSMLAGATGVRMEHVIQFKSVAPRGSLSASPLSGASPLTVNFSGRVPASGSYTLDFGDGSKLPINLSEGRCVDGTDFGACGLSLDGARHVYASAGSYTAKFYANSPTLCYGCQPQSIGSVTITVSGSQPERQLSVTPTIGRAPLTVSINGSVTGSYFGGTHVDFGDGTQTRACAPGGGCAYSLSHTYSLPGIYAVSLVGVGEGSNRAIASRSVTVSDDLNIPPAGSCPTITRNLSRGSQGTDVRALQTYFISIGVLGASGATGYFGPLTEGAVQEWQASHGLISYGSPATTGWGVVGPKTRALIAQCIQ